MSKLPIKSKSTYRNYDACYPNRRVPNRKARTRPERWSIDSNQIQIDSQDGDRLSCHPDKKENKSLHLQSKPLNGIALEQRQADPNN
jgi:predicted nuclease of restriction endonuclease-like (RecB) superfamily